MSREALIEPVHPAGTEPLAARARAHIIEPLPLPGKGQTAQRHDRLFAIAREDLSLARLLEAHWDAVAILAEAGREPEDGALYGVWAAEAPGKALRLDGQAISGSKPFCSGASIVDRALVTVTHPQPQLVDLDLRGMNPRGKNPRGIDLHGIDLRDRAGAIRFDDSSWKTNAFAETRTSVAHLNAVTIEDADLVGESGFYLQRPGFWHGACGPAACWAGGAAGLVDWAATQRRNDPHTLAHFGAMHAALWSMQSCLQAAGHEIDAQWNDRTAATTRALTLRHLIEQACTDILRRLARAYGPHPLAMEAATARRYQELGLYVRQSHAERDLELLGTTLRTAIP